MHVCEKAGDSLDEEKHYPLTFGPVLCKIKKV